MQFTILPQLRKQKSMIVQQCNWKPELSYQT